MHMDGFDRQLEQDLARLAPPLAVYPRPALQTPYLAPRDALEERLAVLFRDVAAYDGNGEDFALDSGRMIVVAGI